MKNLNGNQKCQLQYYIHDSCFDLIPLVLAGCSFLCRTLSSGRSVPHSKTEKQGNSLSQRFRNVDTFLHSDLTSEQTKDAGDPSFPQTKLSFKDASSMTDVIASATLVHSAVQACEGSKKYSDVGCQSSPPISDKTGHKRTCSVSAKSSYYYSLNSELGHRRSFSDSDTTVVAAKSHEVLGKETPKSNSGTMFSPVESFGDSMTFNEAHCFSKSPVTLGAGGEEGKAVGGLIPKSRTRILSVEDPSSSGGTEKQRKLTEPSTSRSHKSVDSSMEGSDKKRMAGEPWSINDGESSFSSGDKQRRVVAGGSVHKCVWQQQVKTLQRRLRSLRKQVSVV